MSIDICIVCAVFLRTFLKSYLVLIACLCNLLIDAFFTVSNTPQEHFNVQSYSLLRDMCDSPDRKANIAAAYRSLFIPF